MKVGIIGFGIVGGAMNHIFKDKADILINDIKLEDSICIDDLCDQSDIIFICVPTPMKNVNGAEINTRILDSVVYNINECINCTSNKNPVICIKSTVIPSKLKEYQENTNINLTMSPEYLTEAAYLDDAVNMKSLVVGGKPEHTKIVVDLYEHYSICKKPYPIGEVDLISAGVLKYMENCFLGMKVIFMNQFFDIHKASGSNDEWQHIAEVFHLDTRMGNSHFMVPGPDGDRGWGGKCFPKDINALIEYSKSIGIDIDIMEKVCDINKRIRTNIDWANIEGAVSNE